jgi:hypothetical protein
MGDEALEGRDGEGWGADKDDGHRCAGVQRDSSMEQLEGAGALFVSKMDSAEVHSDERFGTGNFGHEDKEVSRAVFAGGCGRGGVARAVLAVACGGGGDSFAGTRRRRTS